MVSAYRKDANRLDVYDRFNESKKMTTDMKYIYGICRCDMWGVGDGQSKWHTSFGDKEVEFRNSCMFCKSCNSKIIITLKPIHVIEKELGHLGVYEYLLSKEIKENE